jgi:2-amino-4-hydroxy-6-hydroxymethyldihydropteridine diphosphokinase
MFLGQAATAAPVALYDSINGSTVSDSDGASSGTWLATQFNPDAASYDLNSVVLVESSLSPRELLDQMHEIENAWHRTREVRWGPRTLDLDLIEFEGVTSADPNLTLPHPRAHERAFVLVPWLEADPAAELTGFGPVMALLPTLGDQEITIT